MPAEVIQITDFSDSRLDVFARLTENQLLNREQPEMGMFIAESPKVIRRALDAGCEPLVFLMEEKHVTGEAADLLERCSGIPVFTAPFHVLTQLTGYALTRGALCCMRRPALPSMDQILHGSSRIAVLENVVNPTNVGAIFRSAAALGMDAVLLTPGCSNPLYRRAIRVSMGTVFQIPWTWAESSWQAVLGKNGFRTAALALCDTSISIDAPELAAEKKLALVLGTEGDGLARETIDACDYTVRIPMLHGVDSLNVAAASAVAFWQLRKTTAE